MVGPLDARNVCFYLLNVAVLDTFDPGKDLLDAFPGNDDLTTNVQDRDRNDLC